MNKSILIHNNNTPNNLIVEENIINFNYLKSGYKNIDEYISKKIISILKDRSFNILFIKDNLSFNYLELDGLRLAYHVRLSKELNNKIYIPIVILSDSNGYTLNKLNPIANILFTKNIFITENNQKSIEKFSKLNLKNLTENEYKNEFLNRIDIQTPKESSHDISNEWAIYQWSSLLNISTKQIQFNNNKINTLLYFKYLVQKYNLNFKSEVPFTIQKQSGSILLIDDKCNDGWSDILSGFMEKQYSDITFKSLGKDFKNLKSIDDIKKQVKDKIDNFSSNNKFPPDIILLDLRLMENESETINKISGIQILKYLKDETIFNQGIQIIIFSASSDSSILDEVYTKDILGYIKKDSPTNKYISSKNNFKKLKQLISGKDKGLDRKYLKDIWTIKTEILKLKLFDNRQHEEMKFEINSVFEILDSNMNKKYTYAMLSIFQSLEEINNIYIDDDTKKWIDNYTKIVVVGNYTKQKIEAILKRFNLFKEFSSDINNIAKMRKNAIHPPQRGTYRKPREENILTWFKMLQTILKKISNG